MHSAQMSEQSERLRQARRMAGYESAPAAAEAMGVAEGTYYGHENGHRDFRRPTAERYARFFKVRVEWLMFNRGGPKSDSPTLEDRILALDPEDQRVLKEQLEFMEARRALKRDAEHGAG